MTIMYAAIAIVAWFTTNAIEKSEREELRKRLEQYGPGEVIG